MDKHDELFTRAKQVVQEWLKSCVGDTLGDHKRLIAMVHRALQEVAEETWEGKQDFGGWSE